MKKICFHSFLPALPDQLTACNTLHLTTGLSIKLMHGKQVTRYTPEEFSAFGKKRGKMSGKGQGRRRAHRLAKTSVQYAVVSHAAKSGSHSSPWTTPTIAFSAPGAVHRPRRLH